MIRPVTRKQPLISADAVLGAHLKICRREAGYRSQGDLATELGTSETVVAKAESGERPPTDRVYQDWMAKCHVDGHLRLIIDDLWTLARNEADPAAAQMEPWFKLEQDAHTLRYWAPLIMPGPVQTAEYARELFIAWRNPEEQLDELVAIRTARRSILTDPDGPDVTIVLSERILDYLIGTPEVMRAQMALLVDLCDCPRAHIHVLPASSGAHMGLSGSIDLATTSTTEVLLIEGSPEPVVTSDETRVRTASTMFNTIRSDALRQAESRKVLVEAMERWSKQVPTGESPASAADPTTDHA